MIELLLALFGVSDWEGRCMAPESVVALDDVAGFLESSSSLSVIFYPNLRRVVFNGGEFRVNLGMGVKMVSPISPYAVIRVQVGNTKWSLE
jgi:hypothetical protein